MEMTRCPGCRLILPDCGAADRLNASEACWELYGELSAYTLARGHDFIHQHAVDAYQAQHAAKGGSGIGAAFSLIGLCMAVERGASGLQVQRAHMVLSKWKREWQAFDLPSVSAAMTVRDVLDAQAGDARDAVLRKWCVAVWQSWAHAHEWTRRTCDDLLAESFSQRVRSR